MNQDLIILGCNGYVAAIETSSGKERWRTRLREGMLGGSRGYDVSVLIDGAVVYAGCKGRIYALQVSNGSLLWENELRGMGYNEVSLAREGTSIQYLTRVEQQHST